MAATWDMLHTVLGSCKLGLVASLPLLRLLDADTQAQIDFWEAKRRQIS